MYILLRQGLFRRLAFVRFLHVEMTRKVLNIKEDLVIDGQKVVVEGANRQSEPRPVRGTLR